MEPKSSERVSKPSGGDEPEPQDLIDEASQESFPASDPPSFTPVTKSGAPRHSEKKNR